MTQLYLTLFSRSVKRLLTKIRIICRVFQGLGAAGGQAICVLTIYEMVPPPKYPLYGALVGIAATIGSLTGPLIGSSLSEKVSWRWAFLIK